MSNRQMPSDSNAMAKRLSTSLETVANQLATAKDAEAFLAALHANTILWRDIHTASPLLKWCMSVRRIRFIKSVMAWAEHGINDQEVEALICVNRAAAREVVLLAFSEASPLSATDPSDLSLWRDRMSRRFVGHDQREAV